MEQTAPKRKAPRTAWAKGQSGNPGGRPRRAHALADRVRERLDPDEVIDRVLRFVDDEAQPHEKRVDKLLGLAALGFTKPATISETTLTTNAPTRSYESLSEDELRAMVEARRAASAAQATQDDADDEPDLEAP